ncbi:MAG: four helix bundle protein [Bacteroidota bacterium]
MNNIAEGFTSSHNRDTVHFYGISQSSAAEVKSISYVPEYLKYSEPAYIIDLKEKSDKTRNLALGFIKYLMNK